MSITPPDSAKDIRPGKSARRLEDHRFLTGSARYTADLNRDDQLYAVVIRSDHAHAEILAIDAGLKSRTQAISERGYDAENIDAEIAADKERADALGLCFESRRAEQQQEAPNA